MGESDAMINGACLLAAYFLGSIPFGYLIVKRRQGIDIRQTGSGGTGATNVMRQSGVKAAGAVYALDLAKGVAAVLLSRYFTHGDAWWMAACGVVVILGHIFPVWLDFRGGKGVATGFGVFLVLSPLAVLSALAIWGLVVAFTKYVSLGSIVATASVPICLYVYERIVFDRQVEEWLPSLSGALLSCGIVVIAHHQNIRRLMSGTENKLGAKRDGSSEYKL